MSFLPLAILLFAGTAIAGNRIVGGEDTTIEEYPSIVQVEYYTLSSGLWVQGCGANILLSQWLLSAAHCFSGLGYAPSQTRIRAGSSYRNALGVFHYIEFERNHPDYRKAARYDADIAVVKLSTPLVWSSTIRQGTIITQDFELPDNTPVTYAGWGDLAWEGNRPSILQHVRLYTINHDLCAKRYKEAGFGIVTKNMICAGLLDVGGRDACQGDSGGPLYAQGLNGLVVAGVASWGHRCANGTYPGISTSVASYTDWIIDNARN